MAEKIITLKFNVEDQSLKDLEKELGAIGGEIQKISNNSTGLNLEQKIQAADGAIKTMAGSLQAVVGALGLIGVESEKFGEFEKKAASVIAFGIGVKDVAEGVGKLAVAYEQAGGAAKLFGNVSRKALISTGIGAIVVALGLIAAYWDDITEAIQNTSGKLKKHNEALEKQKKELGTNFEILELQKANLEKQGLSVAEINKKLKDELNAQIAVNDALILNLQTQLEREKSLNREVSFWEKIKIALVGATQPGAAVVEYAKALNENSEETAAKQEEINNLLKEQEKLKGGILDIDKETKDNTQAIVDKEKERLEALKETLSQYLTGIEDLQADSDQKRLDLEKERARKEIELLKGTDAEKKKIYDAFNEYYRLKQEELNEITRQTLLKQVEDEIRSEQEAESRAQYAQAENITNERERINKLAALDREAIMVQTSNYIAGLEAQVEAGQISADSLYVLKDAAYAEQDALLTASIRNQEKQITDFDNFQLISTRETQALKVDIAAQAAYALSEALTTVFANSKEAAIAGVVIEKAAAIAQIVANTAVANAKLIAAFPITLGQPWVGINTAGAVASIATTIAQAGKALTAINNPPKSASGGGASIPQTSIGSSPSATAPSAEAPVPQAFNVQPITRTYVLTGDITSGVEAQAKLNTKRTIL